MDAIWKIERTSLATLRASIFHFWPLPQIRSICLKYLKKANKFEDRPALSLKLNEIVVTFFWLFQSSGMHYWIERVQQRIVYLPSRSNSNLVPSPLPFKLNSFKRGTSRFPRCRSNDRVPCDCSIHSHRTLSATALNHNDEKLHLEKPSSVSITVPLYNWWS